MQEMQSLSSKETTLFEHSEMFLKAGGHMTNWILLITYLDLQQMFTKVLL